MSYNSFRTKSIVYSYYCCDFHFINSFVNMYCSFINTRNSFNTDFCVIHSFVDLIHDIKNSLNIEIQLYLIVYCIDMIISYGVLSV